jgi:hypothetical protein
MRPADHGAGGKLAIFDEPELTATVSHETAWPRWG